MKTLLGGINTGIRSRGVLPRFAIPDPILDQNIPFSTYVFRPGARFSKVPKTFQAQQAICKIVIRLFKKAVLLL